MGKAATRATTARKKTSSSVAAANTATNTTTAASSSSAAAEVARRMKRKKKKGRPSLADLQKREKKTLASVSNSNSTTSRRSTRRNPNSYNSEFVNDDYDDDDDERKEKKVKLVVRLPQSNQPHLQNSSSQNSGSASDSEPEEPEDQESALKKRKINAVDSRSNDVDIDQGEKGTKAIDTLQGSLLESGPTTPLPDKKLLVFILDRLQKKDTYGVFSEPVDPNELPDYLEIIEHPMDFGTVRKKLDVGSYLNLEELEADIFLICSNAMQYNAPDTVYFRQARSIQELAKRDFENLRLEGDDGEPQPKVVRRGRPPSKNVKRPVENSLADRVALELSPGATLASGEDRGSGSNAYNLRKGAAFPKFRSNDGFATPFRPRNGENYSEWLVDWNSEFPASILRADMKYGKKHFSMIDENKRDTYKQFHPSASGSGSYLSNASGDMMMKRLIPVGMHFDPHGYARSLTRYAANLGPVVWKIASQKLRSVLPDGIAFGPGWVGESEAPAHLLSSFAEKQRSINGISGDHGLSRLVTPSSSGVKSAMMSRPSEEMIEAVRRLNSQSELAEHGGGSPWNAPGSPFLAQQKPVLHPNRNGFNAMFGYEMSSQMGVSRLAISSGQPPALLSTNDVSCVPSFEANSEEIRSVQSWGASHPHPNSNVEPEVGGTNKPSSYMILPSQQRQPLAIQPDLNVRVQTSSSPSSSSLQIGSPQQPDLALQL